MMRVKKLSAQERKFHLNRFLSRIAVALWISVIFIGIVLFFYWMISNSFKTYGDIYAQPIMWLPKNLDFSNYNYVLLKLPFPRYFLNSFVIATTSTLLIIFICSFSAYSFSRYKFKLKSFFLFLMLTLATFPVISIVVPLYKMMLRLHLVNTYFSLIAMYTCFSIPFASWMLKSYFDRIPVEIEEAAIMDGCNGIQLCFKIVFPLAIPGIASIATYLFIQKWNEYLLALIFLSKEKIYTVPIGITSFHGQYNTYWNYLTAACVLATLPPVLIFTFLQRYFISGLTVGGVK